MITLIPSSLSAVNFQIKVQRSVQPLKDIALDQASSRSAIFVEPDFLQRTSAYLADFVADTRAKVRVVAGGGTTPEMRRAASAFLYHDPALEAISVDEFLAETTREQAATASKAIPIAPDPVAMRRAQPGGDSPLIEMGNVVTASQRLTKESDEEVSSDE